MPSAAETMAAKPSCLIIASPVYRTGEFLTGNQQADGAVALVEDQDLAVRSEPEPQIGPGCWHLPLLVVLFFDQLEQRLRHTVIVEQDPADGTLSAARQFVGAEIKYLSARVIAEEDEIRQLRNLGAAVDVHAGDGGARLKKRVELPVLHDRVRDFRIAALIRKTHFVSADELEAALPGIPSKVGTGGHKTDLLDDVLPDVRQKHVAGFRVPGKALRIADA